MKANPTTILIIDDHVLIRETWTFILNSNPEFTVIAEAGTAEEGVDLVQKLRPNIVLMDINLRGMNGIEATQKISRTCPDVKVLAVSLHTQPAYAQEILQKGARGYVTKSSKREEMFTAIREISAGEKYICEEIRNALPAFAFV